VDRKGLEQAIAVLEKHRREIGEDVADLTIAALQEKVAQLDSLPMTQQYEDAAVLVADLSGFTAMSELMDAEEVRDTVNAVWQKLDSVIVSWGGMVDKHVGDGVIALFGVGYKHGDDVERAVQAALDMQLELALFNERALKLATQLLTGWARPPDLRMRIGIAAGPVFLGKVGVSDVYTAVGDTVTLAMALEEKAPVGGILIEEQAYGKIRSHFDVEQLEPQMLPGWAEAKPVYVVRREKPQIYYVSSLGAEGISAEMIGRTEELSRLQAILSNAVATSTSHLVTISGNLGVGKSRLAYAFEQWLTHGASGTALFSGRVYYDGEQMAYHVFRDAFANYFEIYPRSSAAAAREKLEKGICKALGGVNTRTREQAHFIGQLLGFDFSQSTYLQGIAQDIQRIREYAFQDIVDLLRSIAEKMGSVVILLEDIHWADEGSLDLLEYLVQTCEDFPIVFVVTTRPELWEKRPSWQWLDTLYPNRCTQIALSDLSSIDSRLLVQDLLSQASSVPMNLMDQIINDTGGNPLFIEEYVKVLIDSGVVVKGPNRWRIEPGNMPTLPRPLTLPDMLVAQFERLGRDERLVLQGAAVLGRIFWETAVVELLHVSSRSMTLAQIEDALNSLERASFIYRRRTSLFTGVPEYVFRHDVLQNLVYSQLDPLVRKRLHAQAASWYLTNGQREGKDFSAVVAAHYALAEDAANAAKWFSRAGEYASSRYAPDTAVHYYNQAMKWLEKYEKTPDTQALREERLPIFKGLGEMHRWQAHFPEAIHAFEQMKDLAYQISHWGAAHEASIGLFICHEFQGNYPESLKYAEEAVALAEKSGDAAAKAIGLAAVGWAKAWLGDLETAVKVAEEALHISTEALAPKGMAYSNMLLGHVYRLSGHYSEATQNLEKAITLLREINDRVWEGLATIQLGHVARDHQDFDVAIQRYQAGLRISRNIGDHFAAMLALQNLSRVCQSKDAFHEAENYLRQALLLAEKSGNVAFQAETAVMFGNLHLTQYIRADSLASELDRQENLELAENWYKQVTAQSQQLKGTRVLLEAQIGLGKLHMINGRPREALAHVLELLNALNDLPAYKRATLAKLQAIAWRLLGSITAELPENDIQKASGGILYQPRECFEKSLSIINLLPDRFEVEKAYTLQAWATYEIYEGDREKGKEMWYEALAMFTALGMVKEVDWMSSFAY
jgi:predicted ATPase/class 3 adenylate cyclase